MATYKPDIKIYYGSISTENRLIPAPNISIAINYNYSNDSIIGYTYIFNIQGTATALDLRTLNYGDEYTEPGEYNFGAVIDHIHKLRYILSQNGNILHIVDGQSDSTILEARGGILKSFSFDESNNNWQSTAEYSASLEFSSVDFMSSTESCDNIFLDPLSFSDDKAGIADINAFKIKTFSDSWAFNFNEGESYNRIKAIDNGQNLNINNGNQAPDRIEQPGNRAQEFALGRARNTSARAREDAETRFGRNPEVMKLQGPEREQKLKSLYTRDGADKKKTRNWDMGQTLEDNIRDHANKKNASDQLLQQQQKDRLGGAAPQPKAAPPPNPDNPEPLRKPQPFVPQAPNQDNRPKMDMDQRTQTQGNGMPDFSSISQSVSSFGAALTTATTALSDYQAKLSSSGSSDSVSNTGGQSFNTDALTEFASKFESLIGQLSQINLPTEITMTGRHEVNVMINGASAFEGMKDGLRDLVMSEINNSMNNYTAGLRQQTEGALA